MPTIELVQITPVDLVLRVASATVGASEVPANTNAGPFVELCQKVTGNKKGDPWCASWVARVGVAALGKLWPVLRTGGCQALYEWASGAQVVVKAPIAGDIFLIWHPEVDGGPRFAHTGFVVRVNADGSCATYEGNTSGGGSREGWIVAESNRRFKSSDRFIRWSKLVEDDQ